MVNSQRGATRENPSEIEKNSMEMRCCVTPCSQTDVGSSQKAKVFLPFRVLQNVSIDPNFPQKSFFCLYSGKNFAFQRKHF